MVKARNLSEQDVSSTKERRYIIIEFLLTIKSLLNKRL
jgi:hypothetical protein